MRKFVYAAMAVGVGAALLLSLPSTQRSGDALVLAQSASPRCPLDVSNPAITHTVIPIHGGAVQGVTQYNGPAEWPFISHQVHWAPSNTMPFDDIANPGDVFNIAPGIVADFNTGQAAIAARMLNPATGHAHLEWCMPYMGDIHGPITIPFRIVLFHMDGSGYMDPPANMTTSIVYDDGATWPGDIPRTVGNPAAIITRNGRLTWDPTRGYTSIANMNGPAANGWSDFYERFSFSTTSGDVSAVNAVDPIWTTLDPTAPLVPDFVPVSSTGTGVTSPGDAQEAWGSQIIELSRGSLPLLAPFNTVWSIPSLRAYTYGGRGELAENSHGFTFMLVDPDIHNAISGRPIYSFNTNQNTVPTNFGSFDPAAITSGKHKVAFVWQMPTGPDGVSILNTDGTPRLIAKPNETLSALVVYNVEVGDVTLPPPPPPPTPTDCVVGPWITLSTTVTASPLSTSGNVQTRTVTTTQLQQRTNIPPTNGGVACPTS